MVNSRAVTIQFRTLKRKGFCTILTHQESYTGGKKQGLSHLVSTRPLVVENWYTVKRSLVYAEMCVEQYYFIS